MSCSRIVYAANNFSLQFKRDNCRPYGQNAEGYGRKIAINLLVRLNNRGRWRRVYCCLFGNSGTLYILVKGEQQVIRSEDVQS